MKAILKMHVEYRLVEDFKMQEILLLVTVARCSTEFIGDQVIRVFCPLHLAYGCFETG